MHFTFKQRESEVNFHKETSSPESTSNMSGGYKIFFPISAMIRQFYLPMLWNITGAQEGIFPYDDFPLLFKYVVKCSVSYNINIQLLYFNLNFSTKKLAVIMAIHNQILQNKKCNDYIY